MQGVRILRVVPAERVAGRVSRKCGEQAVVRQIFRAANYTYGPLLGLFAYGILTRNNVIDKAIPIVGILSPIICYILDMNSKEWFNGYMFGNELLILNGTLTFVGLLLLKKRP